MNGWVHAMSLQGAGSNWTPERPPAAPASSMFLRAPEAVKDDAVPSDSAGLAL